MFRCFEGGGSCRLGADDVVRDPARTYLSSRLRCHVTLPSYWVTRYFTSGLSVLGLLHVIRILSSFSKLGFSL